MSRVEDINKLEESMVEYTQNLTSDMGPLVIVKPEAAVSAGIMGVIGAYIEQMNALNKTMAMIYDDIHTNPSPYTISNLRADMMARGATAQELATLSDLVKKYKGE